MTPDRQNAEVYRDLALERGRPSEPCECRACDCNLHTYPGDIGCIWCSNGQHSDDGPDLTERIGIKDAIGPDRAKTIAVALLLAPVPLAFIPGSPWWLGAWGIPLAFVFVWWWDR